MTETLNLSPEALRELVDLEVQQSLVWVDVVREANEAARRDSTATPSEKK
jgi:hypothetical protein